MRENNSRSRSRSPAPARDGPSRRRSRSPRRRDDKPKRGGGGGGFKWKEKRKGNEELETGERGLERGYRQRSRSPRRNREPDKKVPEKKALEKKALEKNDPEKKGSSVEDKFGVAAKFGTSTSTKKKDDGNTDQPPERAPAQPTSAAYQEPMIIVHVNDRLGTKAAIPCLASDPIKLFKAQVAARIGRQPHEIMLKRQGERPFKDQLTLEDYGVSNGVQIDLEIDTGE